MKPRTQRNESKVHSAMLCPNPGQHSQSGDQRKAKATIASMVPGHEHAESAKRSTTPKSNKGL